MTFHIDNYPDRAAQWLAALKYISTLPARPLDRLPEAA